MAIQQRTSNGKSQQGILLVASPYLRGTPYDRSVVLLVDYGARGARGLLVDDALRASLRQLHQSADTHRRMKERLQVELGVIHWAQGALDQELEHGIWMATTASEAERCVGSPDLWTQLVRGIGRSVLRNAPGIETFPADPSCN